MRAYNRKREPKHTTKLIYRRMWVDCKYQGRSRFVKNKQYKFIAGYLQEVYSKIIM